MTRRVRSIPENRRYKLRAWLTELPALLLQRIGATLVKNEAAGARLRDLDRLRLIGPRPQ